MSPRALDPDTVESRLRLMREALEDLTGLDRVAAAVPLALTDFAEYIASAAAFVLNEG